MKSLIIFVVVFSVITVHVYASTCGNGVLEGTEECDAGSSNVDPLNPTPGCCQNNCTLFAWTATTPESIYIPNCHRAVIAASSLFQDSSVPSSIWMRVLKTQDTCGDLTKKYGAIAPSGTAFFLPPIAFNLTTTCQIGFNVTLNCGGNHVSMERSTTLIRHC
jgi:hypothetical protein